MKGEFQGLDAEKIVRDNLRMSRNRAHQDSTDSTTDTSSMTRLEQAIYHGEHQFGELLKYDKRSLSHVQYVTSFCGSKYVDEYMGNNCHVKALQGEQCDTIRRNVADCVTNLACDKIRDSLSECYTELKRFDQATLVQLMTDTKDLQFGAMKEVHCGLNLKDMLYCVDKYTVLGAVMKTDRRMGSMRYAPLDEESYRTYKQFARKEAKRRREEMENYV